MLAGQDVCLMFFITYCIANSLGIALRFCLVSIQLAICLKLKQGRPREITTSSMVCDVIIAKALMFCVICISCIATSSQRIAIFIRCQPVMHSIATSYSYFCVRGILLVHLKTEALGAQQVNHRLMAMLEQPVILTDFPRRYQLIEQW